MDLPLRRRRGGGEEGAALRVRRPRRAERGGERRGEALDPEGAVVQPQVDQEGDAPRAGRRLAAAARHRAVQPRAVEDDVLAWFGIWQGLGL